MSAKSVKDQQQAERGAAAVEFAIIALLLITLLVGVAEFSRLWFVQASLAAAARDGAREMAVKNDEGDARDAFDAVFVPLGAGTLDVVISPATGGCAPDGRATVVATYEAYFMTGLFPDPPFPNPVILQGTGVMRCSG